MSRYTRSSLCPPSRVAHTDSRTCSHRSNEETAQAAIFGMGLAGAGTNNSRIAGLLRTLATFYKNDANHLFVVRISQALLHAGKVRRSP